MPSEALLPSGSWNGLLDFGVDRMEIEALVKKWFECWRNGNYMDLPVAESFQHSSPFGTIDGKNAYFDLVRANPDKFLGTTITLLDELYRQNTACVRYLLQQEDLEMEVSEWIYAKGDKIEQIHAYYHIGEIREDRKLKN